MFDAGYNTIVALRRDERKKQSEHKSRVMDWAGGVRKGGEQGVTCHTLVLECRSLSHSQNFTTFPIPLHIFFTGLWHTGARWKKAERHLEV